MKYVALILLLVIASCDCTVDKIQPKSEPKSIEVKNPWALELYQAEQVYNSFGELYLKTEKEYGYIPKSLDIMLANADQRLSIARQLYEEFDIEAYSKRMAQLNK